MDQFCIRRPAGGCRAAHVHVSSFAPGARDRFRKIAGKLSESELAQVPTGANYILFLPYLIGERSPWYNLLARGVFASLTMSHTRADMARAVMERVFYNLRLIIDTLESQGAPIPSMRFIAGGAKRSMAINAGGCF